MNATEARSPKTPLRCDVMGWRKLGGLEPRTPLHPRIPILILDVAVQIPANRSGAHQSVVLVLRDVEVLIDATIQVLDLESTRGDVVPDTRHVAR